MSLPQHAKSAKEQLAHPREREHLATYRAYAFGQFRLFYEDKLVKEPMWRRNKAKSLLKWFLLNPGKLCSADQFVDLFWPELPLETAYCNLYVTIHCLRRLLEPTLSARQESKFIHRQSNNFYWFEADASWWIDTTAVQSLFDTAKTFDLRDHDSRASFYYRKIVNFCSLGFLPEDEGETWLNPYRQHYEHIYFHALTRLIQIYQQRNELDDMLEYAYLALALDPYCELAVKVIVESYVVQGNTSMAIHRLDGFHSFLRSKLGVEPSKEMRALRNKILAGSQS